MPEDNKLDNSTQNFNLKIVSRDGVVFQGKVESVSSYNEKGPFDILAAHTNFISLIYKKLTIRINPNDIKEITIGTALLRNLDGNLEIYLGIEESADVEAEKSKSKTMQN